MGYDVASQNIHTIREFPILFQDGVRGDRKWLKAGRWKRDNCAREKASRRRGSSLITFSDMCWMKFETVVRPTEGIFLSSMRTRPCVKTFPWRMPTARITGRPGHKLIQRPYGTRISTAAKRPTESTTRQRVAPRSTSSASLMYGAAPGKARVVRQTTTESRFARALASVSDWCRHHLHLAIGEQHLHLGSVMRGHFAYYGISGNSRRLRWYAYQVERIWQKWLSRRGQRVRSVGAPARAAEAYSSSFGPHRPRDTAMSETLP